ncbi:MAG: toll/interleukin-1 receptor domain-containing protein [Myxococcales bacterium]|nr:toll/interleukin-1 receptor domain-containing protein [Myxococcales bacterium]
MAAKKLFISYSHADEGHRRALETHLALLRRQGLVELWHDRKIVPGAQLSAEIDVHLREADVVLLLISADFLASDYCFDKELALALELQASGRTRVVPVIVRPCDWHSAPFGSLLAVPRDGQAVTSWADRDAAWSDVAASLRRVLG